MEGLCNRMRAIDSAYSIAQKENRKLIVIWIADETINCPISRIFDIPESIKLIELAPQKKSLDRRIVSCLDTIEKFYRPVSRRVSSNILLRDTTLKRFIFHDSLLRLYSSAQSVDSKSLRENDDIFYSKIEPILREIMADDSSVYVSSCHRLESNQGNYNIFKPKIWIYEKISMISADFKDTIGLHIRRTDHAKSIKFSPLSKFEDVVDREIEHNASASFYLATDSLETKKHLQERYGSAMMTNDSNLFDRNDQNAIEAAAVDLFCLAKTRMIYGSHYSSFTQVAADIGGIRDHVVK
jgi:hypothetical protein